MVCGFFPRQDEASSGYCEFHGSFSAIAAAACDYANEKGRRCTHSKSSHWMDSHASRHRNFPFWNRCKHIRSLRTHSFEQRCVAVVVDPLRQEHGVFTSERNAQNRHAGIANDKIKLSEDLQARYHKFLNRLRSLQNKKGKEEIPFILPGLLYQQRVAMEMLTTLWKRSCKRWTNSIEKSSRIKTEFESCRTVFDCWSKPLHG